MTKLLAIKTVWIAFGIAFVLAFLYVLVTGPVHGMEATPSAVQKYNITFPVVELGNCDSLVSCKNFCEDITNKDACIAFAKKKGFYKPPTLNPSPNSSIIAAMKELGCETESVCKQFCGQQQNWAKCGEIAKKYSLNKGHAGKPPPPQPEVADLARCQEIRKKIATNFSTASLSANIKQDYLKYCQPTNTKPANPDNQTKAAVCVNNGCSWTGTDCKCAPNFAPPHLATPSSPQVRGASIGPNLFKQILSFFLGH